jgi:uncharacterized coiled-coil DUF342 family protein
MDKVIHIGAGSGTELTNYIAAGARDIILVEPLPSLTSVLKQKVESIEEERLNIHVLEAAITDDPSASQLLEFNLPGTASLREPKALKTLFPGLKNIARHSVQTLSACELVDHFGPTDTDTALLVIEAPGEALAIIQSLAEADQLKRFRYIHFTSNPEPFYAGSGTAKEVLTLLAQQGYEQLGMDETDPDWMRWRLQRSPLQDEVDALTLQLKQLVQQSAAYHAELEKLRQAYNQQTDELNTVRVFAAQRQQTKEQLETELTQVLEALDASQKQATSLHSRLHEVEATLEQRTHVLVSEKALLEQHNEHYQTELQQLQQASRAQTIELQTVQAEASQHKQAYQALKSELVQLQQQHESTLGELEKNKGWFRSRKQQAETLLAENEELKRALEQQQKEHMAVQKVNQQLENNIQTLQQQLDQQTQEKQQLLQNQQHSEAAFAQLEQRISQMFDQQAALVQQSVSALGQHVTRSFKNQREHFQAHTGLLTYLETGVQPLVLGNWAIDSDLATQLVQTLEREAYDLIIEFGSGTSTVLMARVLAKTANITNDNLLEYDTIRSNGPQRYPAQAANQHHDLPQRILSFEQDGEYFNQTQSRLKQEGLESLVDLVLAPLVPTALTGQQKAGAPLFYSCEQKLMHVAQLFAGRRAKILVLVDGPCSPQKDPLIREPALANLLQHLSAHQLHLLLDDYQREGEQQVATLWQHLCKERGLRCEQQLLNTEKGALRVTITP